MEQLPGVGILGCGWLGLPLAKKLIEIGWQVTGTTTTPEKIALLQSASIQAYLFKAGQGKIPAQLLNSDVLVIAFPPKSKSTDGEWYWKAIGTIFQEMNNKKIKKVILLSSTSVYPDLDEILTEEFQLIPENTGNPALFKAEQIALESKIPVHILRLGGLAGADRLLARHFSGKTNLKNGNSPVNLLHQEDAVNVIELFVLNSFESGIYNVCSPYHPSKRELYESDSARMDLPLPQFEVDVVGGKEISPQKLIKTTGYQFRFPDPKEFTYN